MYKATVTGKRQITIPIEVCNALGITTGSQVEFTPRGTIFNFEKAIPVEHDMCPVCQKIVPKGSPYVTCEDRRYHMHCFDFDEKLTVKY